MVVVNASLKGLMDEGSGMYFHVGVTKNYFTLFVISFVAKHGYQLVLNKTPKP